MTPYEKLVVDRLLQAVKTELKKNSDLRCDNARCELYGAMIAASTLIAC